MSLRVSRFLVPPLAGLLAVCGLLVAPAEAATYTSDGVRCTIVGTAYADTLFGTAGRDVVCGLGGNDRLVGMQGADLLEGGPGADVLDGRGGADVVRGGSGNDLLVGSGGAVLRGGTGDDRCNPVGNDVAYSCTRDFAAPTASLSTTASSVDVSSGSARVTITARLADPAGVGWVHELFDGDAYGSFFESQKAARTSGTIFSGVWADTITIPRGFPAGPLSLDFYAQDRLGNVRKWPDAVTIRVDDRNPDTEFPQVDLLTPTPVTVADTRTGAVSLVVDLRITDTGTGVDASKVMVSASLRESRVRGAAIPADGPARTPPYAKLVSGTINDGRWRTWIPLPEDRAAGDWDLSVELTDRARPGAMFSRWDSPVYVDYQRRLQPEAAGAGAINAFPRGWGRFTVRGVGDFTPPTLTHVTSDRTTASSFAETPIRITLEAPDAGLGTRWITLTFVSSDDKPVMTPGNYFGPDDLWELTANFPKGQPLGTYYSVFSLSDGRNTRVWTSSPTYMSGDPSVVRSDALPKVDVRLL